MFPKRIKHASVYLSGPTQIGCHEFSFNVLMLQKLYDIIYQFNTRNKIKLIYFRQFHVWMVMASRTRKGSGGRLENPIGRIQVSHAFLYPINNASVPAASGSNSNIVYSAQAYMSVRIQPRGEIQYVYFLWKACRWIWFISLGLNSTKRPLWRK